MARENACNNYIKAGILLVLFIILDLLTKWLVISYLDDIIRPLPGVISLEKTQNPGIALGMLPGAQNILPFVIPVGIVIIAFFLWKTPPSKPWEFYGYVCILGGAIGNYIDRILNGKVTDFIRMDFLGHLFPYIFNVADIIICTGVGFVILQLILDMRRKSHVSDSA